jgi:hypothetical protein
MRRDRSPAIAEADASLLDVIDHVLNKGLVLSGEVVLGLAGVDLVYLRLAALVAAADRAAPRGKARRRKRPSRALRVRAAR